MHPGQYRRGAVDGADDQGQMFAAAVQRAERDDFAVLGVGQRHTRRRRAC